MEIHIGDKIESTRQRDGSFNVTVYLKHVDGDQRFVANVTNPDAYYEKMRALVDTPFVRDLERERETLLDEKAEVEKRIIEVDALITTRDKEAG